LQDALARLPGVSRDQLKPLKRDLTKKDLMSFPGRNRFSLMPNGSKRLARRVELGRHVVSDPAICDGVPTFKGTRIMVWQVLDALGRGESWDDIVSAWAGGVSKAGIAETIRLAREALLDEKGRLLRPVNRRLAA